MSGSRKGKMTVEEAGRKGGEKTARTMVLSFTVKSVAKEDREFEGLFWKEKSMKQNKA